MVTYTERCTNGPLRAPPCHACISTLHAQGIGGGTNASAWRSSSLASSMPSSAPGPLLAMQKLIQLFGGTIE